MRTGWALFFTSRASCKLSPLKAHIDSWGTSTSEASKGHLMMRYYYQWSWGLSWDSAARKIFYSLLSWICSYNSIIQCKNDFALTAVSNKKYFIALYWMDKESCYISKQTGKPLLTKWHKQVLVIAPWRAYSLTLYGMIAKHSLNCVLHNIVTERRVQWMKTT